MTEPVKIELTLDLDKHLASFRGYNRDGEVMEGPTTLEDVLIDRASLLLLERVSTEIKRDAIGDFKRRVRSIQDEEIRKAIAPAVQEALTGPIQKTNSLGEKRGEETTLREEILIEAREALKVASVRSDLRRTEASPLQKMVRDEVEKVLAKELKTELDAAKAEVLAAVRAKGAEVLVQTMASMTGVKA